MKLYIDIEKKELILNSDENLDNFFKVIKKLFPEDWKEYKLKHVEVVNYYPTYYPITYNWATPSTSPFYENGKITCNNGDVVNATTSIYCVDIQNLN